MSACINIASILNIYYHQYKNCVSQIVWPTLSRVGTVWTQVCTSKDFDIYVRNLKNEGNYCEGNCTYQSNLNKSLKLPIHNGPYLVGLQPKPSFCEKGLVLYSGMHISWMMIASKLKKKCWYIINTFKHVTYKIIIFIIILQLFIVILQ